MKAIEYYRTLPYTKRVQRFEDEGIYYVASIEELPFIEADGATPEEALKKLSELWDEAIAAMLDAGDEIPEPLRWPDNLRASAPAVQQYANFAPAPLQEEAVNQGDTRDISSEQSQKWETPEGALVAASGA